VNIASISGIRGSKGRSAYGASKGAVINLTKVMATDLAPFKIRVNAVAPGPVEFFDKTTLTATFENEMHGGQIGGRWYRQRGHWLVSLDLEFFAMANFQHLRRIRERSFLANPDEQDGNTVVTTINPFGFGGDVNRTLNHESASQFVWGGEVRGEASYELTRDVNLRFGFVFLDLGQGIGRGNLIRLNNQAVQMAGVTFGFTVNR